MAIETIEAVTTVTSKRDILLRFQARAESCIRRLIEKTIDERWYPRGYMRIAVFVPDNYWKEEEVIDRIVRDYSKNGWNVGIVGDIASGGIKQIDLW